MIRAKDNFLRRTEASCRDVQHETLRRLLHLNGDSRFAAERGLSGDLTVKQFRERIAVSDYETFRPAIDAVKSGDHRALLGSYNKLLMFAITSGTTASSKLIPVTEQFLKDYRRGWQHWGMGIFQSFPEMSLLRLVQISSTHQKSKADDGTPCGNISGLASSMQKRIVRKLYTIPSEVAAIDDPKFKRRCVATFALADPWVGVFVTANPSTLLRLLESAKEDSEDILRCIHDGRFAAADKSIVVNRLSAKLKASPQRAKELQSIIERHSQFSPGECWPHLQALALWTGGSAAAYLPQIKSVFGELPVRDHGLHASEGRMTIPFENNTSAGILDTATSFFEFIPVEESDSTAPTVLEADELQEGCDYLILLTTSSGFYRYNIYDVVRCVGFHGTTPLLTFQHKAAHISSITGEKITETQVVEAVRRSTSKLNIEFAEFSLTPFWGEPPGYELLLNRSHSGHSIDLNKLSVAVDRELSSVNIEYAEKRDSGRLAALKCEVIPTAAWKHLAANRLASSGGSIEQYKHPFLVPDSRFENTLRQQFVNPLPAQ